MPRNAKSLCRHCGLTYVETADLRLLRRRRGKGFSFIDDEGHAIRDKAVKARIRRLTIPPAWTEVRIAEDERAHIQAVGRDGEGRLQYRYHDDWGKVRTETKLQRLLRLGSALPRLRDAVRTALAGPDLTRKKASAAAVRLIDRALLRPGHEEYARASGSRGASTLLKRDVVVKGDKVVLEYKGKGGQLIKQAVKDGLLAHVVTELFEQAAVQHADDNGQVRSQRVRSMPSWPRQPAPGLRPRISYVSSLGRGAEDFERKQQPRNRETQEADYRPGRR